VAVVEVADDAATPRLDDLRALVKEHLPAFAAPRELILVPALPRTALGKIRRDTLPG
jgi:O-succinylbenzoic acid--CoA ligase